MLEATDKTRYHDGTKLLWHMDRVIEHFDKGKRVPPIHIDAGLTKKCNERCIYCYGAYQNMDGSVMSRTALVDNLVKSAAKIGVRSLAFIGDGEPTLNPYLYEALEEGGKSGLSLSLSTSGYLLDSDEKRKVVLENCEWMRFNISAFTASGFKQVHGVTEHFRNKVIENITKLVEYKHKHNLKCDIGLQTVFVPRGVMVKELRDIAYFAREVGVDYYVIKQCSLPDAGESGMAQFELTDYQKPEIVDLLKGCALLSTPQTQIIPKWNLLFQTKRPYDRCVAPPLIWEVSGNADCFPCGYFFGNNAYESFKLGNLENSTLEEIVYSDRYWEIMQTMKEFDVHTGCKGACRLDKCNEFIWNYLQKPKGINFI